MRKSQQQTQTGLHMPEESRQLAEKTNGSVSIVPKSGHITEIRLPSGLHDIVRKVI